MLVDSVTERCIAVCAYVYAPVYVSGCLFACVVQVVPEELELYELVGKGSSSYVQKAEHMPTGTMLALKVINMFDKTKRSQLIKEINALYDADCDW